MKIAKALTEAKNTLEKNELKDTTIESEILLCFVLKKNKEYLYTYPEKELTYFQKYKYQRLIRKRIKNIPLPYITGKKTFYGFDFLVNKHVLIPRSETELIIDEVLKLIKEVNNSKKVNIIDVGTGSGCIITTLSNLIQKRNVNFYGIDNSKKALKIAKKNSFLYYVIKNKVTFLYSDLFKYFTKNKKTILDTNIITANLPYITMKEFKKLKTIQKEPRNALVAKNNGLYYYKKLFKQIKNINTSNKKYYIFCEINPCQVNKIIKLIKKYFPKSVILVKKDIRGLDRLIILEI